MTICLEQDANGFIKASPEPLETCSTLIAVSAEEYNYITSHTSVTGAEVVEFYSFGFAIVFFGYIISFPIRALLKTINLV